MMRDRKIEAPQIAEAMAIVRLRLLAADGESANR